MLAKTPPMGWNSWDCYGAAVTEKTVRENADYMAKHLKPYGYEYVVVDIQWYEPTADSHEYKAFADLTMDEYSRLLPAPNRFPSSANGAGFKPLADYVHGLGLKFGIHMMRGIPRQAAHRDTKIKGTNRTARQIARTNSICYWNPDMYGVNPRAPGAVEYYNSLFELYAEWGVDFVKVDDIAREYHIGEIELIHNAIKHSGRDIVLSISPGATPLERAEHLKQYVNMWRITDDFWDRWDLLYAMFERAEKWCVHAMPGHFPDADMLPVAAIRQNDSPDNRTKFTQDEQMCMMTLWCMLRSPLMIGSELTRMDDFTVKLLTNEGLLEILNTSHSAHPVYRRGEAGKEEIVWFATSFKGGYYIALFNTDDAAKEISVTLADCGLDGPYTARELWSNTESSVQTTLTATVNPHGAKVFKLM